MDRDDGKELQMNCPVCGNAYHEGKICPQQGEQAVCIDCCRACRYQRRPKEFVLGCNWYNAPENRWRRIPEEVERMKNKAASKHEQAMYFYRKNKPLVAMKIEQEEKYLLGEIRKMEEEYGRHKKA